MRLFSRAVERLRQLLDGPAPPDPASPASAPMMECPRCGRCDEPDVRVCPADGTTMRASATTPRVLEGKYRIERLLGRGGMGSVYRAHDIRLDRPVAIKVIRAELVRDPAAQDRFQEEARTLARLQHPAIVAVFDFGTLAGGSPYLVMELVRGDDLRRELAREGRLETSRAHGILSAVCGAMEAAHRQGVLHCDLKPENILLPDEGVEAKVLDFGVARALGAKRRVTTAPSSPVATIDEPIIGTPAYMAPEQLHGESADARTDVFGLGVIAYEMLVGDLPFGGGSVAEVALAQARGVPPRELDALPPLLARAVRAALAQDPDRRPPSPQAFGYLISAATGTL